MPAATITRRKGKGATNPAEADPLYILERDGITFSLLSTFRDCRWKARNYLNGLTKMTMGLPIIFGNVVHEGLELAYQGVRDGEWEGVIPRPHVAKLLDGIETLFKEEHPRMSPEMANSLELSMLLAQQVMPRYFSYWSEKDGEMAWIETEQEFRIPITVTLSPLSRDGVWQERTVNTFLRGKIDGLFKKSDGTVGVLETKTKGRVEPGNIMSYLPYNLQVAIYVLCAETLYKQTPSSVLYNIVRRPQLQQRKSESIVQFSTRVGEDIDTRPDFYFMRINMDFENNDLVRMRGMVEDTVRDFVLWWIGESGHYPNDNHCENKYGTCEFLDWCGNANRLQYYVRAKLFSELEAV